MQLRSKIPLNSFDVWPENAEIVSFFLSLESQWQETPLGMGLNYTAVHSCINAAYEQRHKRRSVFLDIRRMEAEASGVLS